MTGHDFIAFAGRLVAARNPDEPACRSAISRACYGAFHLASGFLRDLGFQIADRHASVWRYLQLSKHPDAERVGHRLNTLYQQRIRADYRLDTSIDLPQARFCVEEAVKIEALLENALAVKDDIRRNIEAHLQKFGGKLP